jgi:hypothetical protein
VIRWHSADTRPLAGVLPMGCAWWLRGFGFASRQVVEEKTSACIRDTGYADADSSCGGASLSPSITVSEQAPN